MTCEDLCFVGMRVKIKDAEKRLYGTILDEYNEIGTMVVTDIFESDNVQLSNGGLYVNYHRSCLIPTIDENILETLNKKIKEGEQVKKEISDIKSFINHTINEQLKLNLESV